VEEVRADQVRVGDVLVIEGASRIPAGEYTVTMTDVGVSAGGQFWKLHRQFNPEDDMVMYYDTSLDPSGMKYKVKTPRPEVKP